MLPNSAMKPNRFLTMHNARKRIAWIKERLAAGDEVYVSTYLRATKYQPKHADMLKAFKDGAFMQRSKNWDGWIDCIDGCKITSV